MSTRKRSVKTVGRTGRGRERLPAELSQANLNASGIDVGASSHFAAVSQDRSEQPVREFAAYTADLYCLAECGVETVVMESTGVYWIPLYSGDEVRERFGVEPLGQAQLIVGMLAPATLLDILRDFVVYEPEQGRVVKQQPSYQQFRAVKSAMQRILLETKAEERGGVVWHTQGSGKSLTMLWLATKIRREPRLANADIVVVTDRTQLDKQISDTFRHCGFPAPERVDRSRPEPEECRARRRRETPNQAQPRDLQTVLRQGGGRAAMTTIQKFEEAMTTPDGKLAVRNLCNDGLIGTGVFPAILGLWRQPPGNPAFHPSFQICWSTRCAQRLG